MITFYDCATAPSPRRARILLAEKGVAHETVQIDLRAGEQLGNAYRAINPQCTVPALRTDEGQVLTDNAAIAAYLEARYPQPPLLGRSALDKAEIAGDTQMRFTVTPAENLPKNLWTVFSRLDLAFARCP